MEREYPGLNTTPEHSYDHSIEIDLEKLPESQEDKEDLIKRISLMKRNAFAAPFERAFEIYDILSKKYNPENPPQSTPEVITIHYREEESIFITPSHDRVTVVFSTVFREETDRILGKIFLQEFVDARRRQGMQQAPQVLYSRDPPLEIRDLPGLRVSEDIGYITFVLFPRHLTPQKRDDCTSKIQLFRDYFHYHIKCSKVYMHSRMRARVSQFLKVINRARPENQEKTERRTASGRYMQSGRK